MNSASNILTLRRLPLLHHLNDAEIGLVARACRVRAFEPAEQVAPGDHPLRHLHVIVEGSVERESTPLPQVFGETSLLLGHLPGAPLLAGPAGARCLLLDRRHFFTLVNECPRLLAEVLDRLSTCGIAEIGIPARPEQ